ncbi:hypothetical protein MKW92_050747 [Papaver armeniacum]|nr:hypothetical protein MKW92_050747 [Papaver armeniacum]
MLAVFPAVPFLPIGRTAGSLLGAMLMVMFRVITPEQAYSAIDLPILGLLFGTMVVSIYLERADMFNALFTNDTCCVVLTEFVLKIAKQNNLPPRPFLLALASSANIGSSATQLGKITFEGFIFGIFPAMIVGVVMNTIILLGMFWRVLSVQKDEEDVVAAQEIEVAEEDVSSHRFSPATMSHSQELEGEGIISRSSRSSSLGEFQHMEIRNRIVSSPEVDSLQRVSLEVGSESARIPNGSKENGTHTPPQLENTTPSRGRRVTLNGMSSSNLVLSDSKEVSVSIHSSDGKEGPIKRWKRSIWKTSVYLVTIGMLIALLLGLNMSWTAITASLALVVLDFKDAGPSLEKVSYSLLIFFCGMFITVDGFNKNGNTNGIVAAFAVVILVLSNLASNVPTVLLLGARVAASAAESSPANEKKAWLILAWVSTVAGNLSLLGSAANLIVCEQARRAQLLGYNLSFWSHLKFGLPSTVIVTAIGLLLIKG